jgi:hypothetical protein
MNLIKYKMKSRIKFTFGILIFVFLLSLVSAGVGIRWDRESALVPENEKTCMTYGVYNPWSEDTYVKIVLSTDLQEILSSSDADLTFVPKGTPSSATIPVTFCFKTPTVYEKDCLIGQFALCKQECVEPMKIYEGEVEVIETDGEVVKSGGSGGSSTQMSVSAPLRVKVQCVAHKRNYSLIYISVALVAIIVLAWEFLFKKKLKKRKSKK